MLYHNYIIISTIESGQVDDRGSGRTEDVTTFNLNIAVLSALDSYYVPLPSNSVIAI